MNRVAKAVILSVAALTTVASTVELASAGDRYWRRHHVVKPWKKRVVVTGVTAGVVAGAIVATRPRVIYREEPVIIDQAPVYDRETVYDDDTVYADPDESVSIYRDDVPEGEEFAAPAYDEGEEQVYDEDRIVGTENNYFPDRPQPRVERKSNDITIDRKQATIGRQPKKTETVKEANAADLKPWSKEWKEWCTGRFSSFNPQNGTYLGYDQKRHFCKAG